MPSLENKIEAILFFKNEPVLASELEKLLKVSQEEIRDAIKSLQESYKDRGIVIVNNGDEISFGTNPSLSELIEGLQKEEFSRELGRAGLETLSIVLYKGPISRREIDHIRGVNSSFILRNLMIRGLVERAGDISGERSFSYKPTLKLFEHLGITRKEDLPEFEAAFTKIESFVKSSPEQEDA